MDSPAPQLRIARPSRDLKAAAFFYIEALGLELLDAFEDHAGFDGVILGHPTWPYHLEFTRRRLDPLPITPTDEDLLVFYFPDRRSWKAAADLMRAAGAPEMVNANPYWRQSGITFLDPDGYSLVLYCSLSGVRDSE